MKIRKERDIYSTFPGRVIYRGLRACISSNDAERFLDHIFNAKKDLIGMEAITLGDRMTRLEYFLYFVDSEFPKSYDELRKFISQYRDKVTYFTFDIDECLNNRSIDSDPE